MGMPNLWYNGDVNLNQIVTAATLLTPGGLTPRKELSMPSKHKPQLSLFKTCTKCGELKPVAEFYIRKNGQGSRQTTLRLYIVRED